MPQAATFSVVGEIREHREGRKSADLTSHFDLTPGFPVTHLNQRTTNIMIASLVKGYATFRAQQPFQPALRV